MASEYGWDHVHIRERFTRAQLELYLARFNERMARQSEARETGGSHSTSTPWRVEYEMAKRRGEIERVYGVN